MKTVKIGVDNSEFWTYRQVDRMKVDSIGTLFLYPLGSSFPMLSVAPGRWFYVHVEEEE